MLKARDVQLLTQTGPGTPMGELFRRFWLPALLPKELPEPDCPPIRVRMLGEDLVAFRDMDSNVAFIHENCPHRGASLFFGRNEECGLRCVYHGWKFDASGACVDMPNEPLESNFKDKVKAAAYPGAIWGGVVWIYMGPRDLKPELPQFEWCLVPDDQRAVSRWSQECNYAQAMEGDLDTAHVSFLHLQFEGSTPSLGRRSQAGQYLIRDGAPRLTAKETDYGFCYGARRQADGGHYWRVTQWLLPGYSLIPSATSMFSGGSWIPTDDHHCCAWRFAWDTEGPIPEELRPNAGAVPRLVPGTVQPVSNTDNDYLIDRELQRDFNFTGIADFRAQDIMATESMGPIMDRTREHLGTADLAIIVYRRRLLRLAQALQQGNEPWAASHGSSYRVRPLDVIDAASELDDVLRRHEQAVFRPYLGSAR